MKRFWIYQRERFPLVTHGPVIAAFSASAIAFSAFARGASFPHWWLLLGGFASSLCFFAQIRIADEWKDAADDAALRPYRPVPRGLVTLHELAWIGVAAGAVQLSIALVTSVRLVPLLVCAWTFFALMSREFFVRRWLRAHPVAYMLSHMAIVPLIDAYVSSFDWLVAGVPPPHALWWFLAVTFCNGLVIEIGRKMRAPADEEPGVETYTAIWGRARATAAWCAAFAATAALATLAAAHVAAARFDAPLFVAATAVALACGAAFLRRPLSAAARRIESASGVWTVGMYAALGLLPFFVRSVI